MLVYKIEDIPEKEVVKGYFAKAIHTGNISFVYWRVEAGDSLPVHTHPHQQVAQVLAGKFELTVAETTYLLEPGMVVVIPPFAPHGGKAVENCSLLDVFYPERNDYKFDGS